MRERALCWVATITITCYAARRGPPGTRRTGASGGLAVEGLEVEDVDQVPGGVVSPVGDRVCPAHPGRIELAVEGDSVCSRRDPS